jgi:hypothetical protein
MKLTLTQDEIKNHYREMFNLDQSDEIVIEETITLKYTDEEMMLVRKIYDSITSKLNVEDAEKMEDILEKISS